MMVIAGKSITANIAVGKHRNCSKCSAECGPRGQDSRAGVMSPPVKHTGGMWETQVLVPAVPQVPSWDLAASSHRFPFL